VYIGAIVVVSAWLERKLEFDQGNVSPIKADDFFSFASTFRLFFAYRLQQSGDRGRVRIRLG
jgi:hypothetical protein